MPFVGLDLHKKSVEAVILADDGRILHRDRFPTTRAALQAFARRHLSPDHRVAVEATFNTWPVVDVLEPFAGDIVISNPLRTKAIAQAKIKTDKVDALVLAHLLRADFLPRVWRPDAETRSLRHQTTQRANLTADRTRLKNRIHAVLHQRLIEAPKGDLFSAANLGWLLGLELDDDGRETLHCHLRLLAAATGELEWVDRRLARHAWHSGPVKLLMTLPGVDVAVAETLLATLGDITRFRTPEQAAAYLGLVPSTRQSGEHCYHGPITRQGRAHARWMMVQAAQHLGNHPGPLGVFFRRLAQRKNRNVAVVAVARKLVMIAWHMLTHNEPYRYGQPVTLKAKMSRLRIRATGQKRRGGLAKGAPRPAAYGTGQGTRAVPALDAVYAAEGLPPLAGLTPGERRMLEREGLTGMARQVRESRRVRRGSGAAG
ncbi:MAG: IS110 family transposase [Bryobacterales bacterium]|nr:IS110 family transposase [Bryobacterales bacterium]